MVNRVMVEILYFHIMLKSDQQLYKHAAFIAVLLYSKLLQNYGFFNDIMLVNLLIEIVFTAVSTRATCLSADCRRGLQFENA